MKSASKASKYLETDNHQAPILEALDQRYRGLQDPLHNMMADDNSK